LGLLVQLIASSTLRARRTGAKAAAPAGGHVLLRQARRSLRLAVTRPLLVDRARGDLLCGALRRTLLTEAALDVLVLPSTLRPLAYATWRHDVLLSVRRVDRSPPLAALPNCLDQ